MTVTPELPPVAPQPVARRPWLPRLRSRWWTLLLGLSLMANLMVGGLLVGHRFAGGPPERLVGASYVQLIPRGFFISLPHERRRELMQIVRDRSKELRVLRETSNALPLKLADALEASTYDAATVKSAVDDFATGSESLAAGGGAVVMDIVTKLTPEERKALALAIRDRADKQGRRKRN